MNNECNNCQDELDKEYILAMEMDYLTTEYETLEELKAEYDYSINQACGTCYHTWWLNSHEKEYLHAEFVKDYD